MFQKVLEEKLVEFHLNKLIILLPKSWIGPIRSDLPSTNSKVHER